MAASGTAPIIKVGPAGWMWSSDRTWDDKGHANLTAIYISHDVDSISSLQFQYEEDGSLLLTPDGFVSHTGPTFSPVTFDGVTEYITGVSGITNSIDTCITELTFETNQRKYGPFGGRRKLGNALDNREFNFKLGPSNQFGGFYGSFSNTGLRSIGVYLKPAPPRPAPSVSGNSRMNPVVEKQRILYTPGQLM